MDSGPCGVQVVQCRSTVFGKLDKVGKLSENKQIQASIKCFNKYDFEIVETMSRKRKRTKTNRR